MADFLSFIPPAALARAAQRGPIRVLGIDLGTTNSTVSEIEWDPASGRPPEVRCLEIDQLTDEGRLTHLLVPSMVAVSGDVAVVGERAKRWRSRLGELGLKHEIDIFWDCKNEIGTGRTYHRAAEGFRSPKEIATHVLSFLRDAASKDATPAKRTVITVPASFMPSHREDTLEAGRNAGFEMKSGDLLDEPMSALLDHLFRNPEESLGAVDAKRNVLVFDFGGGTCDVAVFELRPGNSGEALQLSARAVSRYHRLGGGDIDLAIVHQVLIPALLVENGISRTELDWETKAKRLGPMLLGIAEQLKIGLCYEIGRLKGFGRYDTADKSTIVRKMPGQTYALEGRTVPFSSPSLTAKQFEKLLEPFLDPDTLYPKETDYVMMNSIFSPLHDALFRAGLKPEEVDVCLLVGGSVLIPQVQDAVQEHFTNAKVIRDSDPDHVQTSVARGAAWHALALELTGRGILAPVTGDSLSILTSSGPIELVARGASLPQPAGAGEWLVNNSLVVPSAERATEEPLQLRIEVVDGNDRPVIREVCDITQPLSAGEGLLLRYRVDENQVLHVEVTRASTPDAPSFKIQRLNPLTHVVSPQSTRAQILEMEEALRSKSIPRAQMPATVQKVATLYGELGQVEKALGILKGLLAQGGERNPRLLHRMGMLSNSIQDYDKEEEFYREASLSPRWSASLFNLALSFRRRGMLNQALEVLDEAVARDDDPPTLVMRALTFDGLGSAKSRDADLKRAMSAFDSPKALNEWELGWFVQGARLAGDAEKLAGAEAEQKRRAGAKPVEAPIAGLLPDVNYALGPVN
ncbi:MAG: Hsp70 family protein [Thermoanaerobaculia bacterium]